MKKPRLMVIGLDSVSLTLLDTFRSSCPAIHRLMKRGLTGRAIPCLPVYTPTNWAALSTGADSSTTAAAGWHNDIAGKRLSTFDRRAIPCDTIFDSAARAGLRTLAIAYPTSHPTASPLNMVLAPLDRGLVSNCLVPGKIVDAAFDRSAVFKFVLLEAPEAASGASLANAVGATEDGEDVRGTRATGGGTPPVPHAVRQVHAYLFRDGTHRWKLGFSPDAAKAHIRLRPEEWSEPIHVHVGAEGRPGRCVLRVMVFDNGRRLAVSEAYDIGMLGRPASLAAKVFAALGPPTEHSVFLKKMTSLFKAGGEDATITRLARRDMEAQARWIVGAAALVQKLRPFDVFYHHYHYPDNELHTYLTPAEGSELVTPLQTRLAKKAIAMSLSVCDRLVAGLLKLAGPETTVLLVSDHGNVSNRFGTDLNARLVETGLLKLARDGSIDRRRSLAWKSPDVSTWIMVNAKPGTARYEELQRKVIDALLDWKTPAKERVIALALRRKDSHMLGYYGRQCGDVTFHYNSGFSWFGRKGRPLSPSLEANHGPQMPVTFSKLSDNLAFYVLSGPAFPKGLRRDEETKGYIHITDLVPTVCVASGVPAPVTATGATRRELLVRK